MVHENYFRRTGFRSQLTVIVTVAILGLAVFSSIVNSWEASQRMEGYLVEQGQHVADNLARQSTLAVLYHSADNARESVDATLAFPDVLHVQITDAAHDVLLSQAKPGSQPPQTAWVFSQAPIRRAVMERETGDEWYFGAPIYGGQQDGASPFDLHDSAPELIGYVHVVLSKSTLHKLVNSLFVVNLAITLSFAIILLALVRLLTGRMLRPLHKLSVMMGRAEAGDSGMRADAEGPRDIIDMANAFNKMMRVLEEREAELKHSRDVAVHAGQLKAQFAATVSHEVRTPLNGVVGMLDLLKEMRLTKRQQECVDIAWNSSHALIDLINDILDFSKMEAGKLELEEIDFDLRRLVEEVIGLLARQAHQKGLEIGYLFAADVPERVTGDSLRLRQVLVNLISNAVKFTERGEIAVRVFLISGTEDEMHLRFEVSDTGIGMEEDAAQHVFESFAQADRSTTRKYGGTGLGLAICKQLVEMMGGEIGVSSERGAGSIFYFTIECRPGVAVPANDDHSLQGVRILAVDESPIVRAFLEQSLGRIGMRCDAVPNGAEAMNELRKAWRDNQPYRIVAMDTSASDGDNGDLARCIRSDGALGSTRLLLLDRYGSSAAAGVHRMNGYLHKPLSLDRLLDEIHALLSDVGIKSDPVAASPVPGVALFTKECRVLVAEDNRTNQMVAAGMLSITGCHCEFAANGREAMEAARANRFDLILMDCSMPEMDGYEATAHIRNFEEPLGLHTPIVAMTANTQHGDAEKCLAAGMDDYLAKPITLAELRSKLERWLGPAVSKTAAKVVAWKEADSQDESAGLLDREVFDKLREILGPSLQQALIPFFEDTPGYIGQLEQAAAEEDAEKARAAAHSIKGCSGNLGAVDVARIAKVAEESALEGRTADIRALIPELREAFNAVAAVLANEMYLDNRVNSQNDEEGAQVLIVDDDRSTRGMLRYTLQRDGFRVEEAVDGEQALSMLKSMQPDVILMDAVMPVMDGFTACARVQELPYGRAIPVLMITALEDNASVERAFAAGASDFIPKPIHFAVLSQRVRRIIEANHAEKRIRHMAYNDLLTGLPNRALFLDQLGRRIEQARQVGGAAAVLFLDLDRFKYVNDTLGHEMGDKLLIEVGQRIRRSVRNADCVARLGGDEFTVVLADISGPGAAAAAAQNICRALATPFQLDGHDIFVATSVGISLYPHDGTDVGTLLKHADTAMYRAKRTKSGFQFFEASMERSVSDHLRLENDLRRALERNELEVFYQPQVRLESGETIGVEALARWHHPVRGFVSPVEFIPLAEETGLIIQLGEWVLRTSCMQLSAWLKEGRPAIRMAVNISVRQLLQKDFAEKVESALRDSGVPPRLLELEITESTLMEHAEETLQALQRLRDLGIRLTIDDFGTGYSSLAYLKRFPVDIIKIDRSFVRDVPTDADDAAIVKGIIALAHSLRLELVAEGVENMAQIDFLREQGCDLLQGYFFSEPVPAARLIEYLENPVRLGVEDNHSCVVRSASAR